jgi:hypothetical protein
MTIGPTTALTWAPEVGGKGVAGYVRRGASGQNERRVESIKR